MLQSSGVDGGIGYGSRTARPAPGAAGPREEVAQPWNANNPASSRWRIACLVAGLVLALSHSARAQLTTQEEERLQILSDPDAIKKKLDKKRNRPPFEFFKSQVAPFDVLPFVKAQSLEHPDPGDEGQRRGLRRLPADRTRCR